MLLLFYSDFCTVFHTVSYNGFGINNLTRSSMSDKNSVECDIVVYLYRFYHIYVKCKSCLSSLFW